MTTVCLDSSGWIEMALDGANAKKFAKCLTGGSTLVVSAISLYEIAKYVTRESGEAVAEEMITFISQYPVVEVTRDITLSASGLSVRHRLAMADSLIYATALAHNATLWTQDEDFKGLPNVKCIPKSQP